MSSIDASGSYTIQFSLSGSLKIAANAFSPTDIAGLHAWYKGNTGVLNASDAPAANGEAVKTWQDQSGNSRHATQSTPGSRPIYTTAGANPALNFDGIDDYLLSSISVSTTTVTAFFAINMTTAAVARLSSIVASTNADFNDSRSAILVYYPSGTVAEGYRNPNDKSQKTGISAAPYDAIICSQFDGANHTLYFNSKTGQTPVASAEGAFNAVEWYLGCGRGAPGTPITFTDCFISEALLYTTSLSTVDRDSVMDYLNAKYVVF